MGEMIRGKYIADLTHKERVERRRQIALFIKSGNTVADCIKRFKISKATIDTACLENGVTPPVVTSQSAKHGWSQMKVMAMLVGGCSRNDVCSKLGVSRQYVSQCVQAAERNGLIKAISKLIDRDLII